MAAAQVKYASATYGSEAYDLDRVRDYALPDEETAQEPTQEEQIRERLNERARAREQAKAQAQAQAKSQTFGVPLLGVVGAIVTAVLMVTVLMGYIKLAEISGETSKVRSSIADLEERSETLALEYETTFDMQSVEAYAVNILGMTKGDAEEIYTDVILADRAQVLSEDETAGVFARIAGFFKSLPEYFS